MGHESRWRRRPRRLPASVESLSSAFTVPCPPAMPQSQRRRLTVTAAVETESEPLVAAVAGPAAGAGPPAGPLPRPRRSPRGGTD